MGSWGALLKVVVMFTPRTCMCKGYSSCWHKYCQICLGTWTSCKHNRWIYSIWPKSGFSAPRIDWHSLYASVISSAFLLSIIATPINPHPLCIHRTMCFLLMCTVGLVHVHVGKGHQLHAHMSRLHIDTAHAKSVLCKVRTRYVFYI